MCRWLAYLGEPLTPAVLILDTQHSLVAQSLNSPLGAETVNGDGFGMGWYPEHHNDGDPASLYHSIEPAWNDQNLREIANAVVSPMFLSHVRAAAGPPIQQSNCHPYRHGKWLFAHNGFLAGFDKVKRDLTLAVDPSLYPEIRGTTDSEVLFYLAITFGAETDPIAGITKAVTFVESTGRQHGVNFPMQGTLALSDGSTLWAFRYSSQGRTRTLFHSTDIPTLHKLYPDAERLNVFGDHAQVVVSEPLNDLPGVFVEVPESTVAVLDKTGYHHQPFMEAA